MPSRAVFSGLLFGAMLLGLAEPVSAGDEQALCLGWRSAGQTYDVGRDRAHGVTVADLDGDGLPEILVAVSEDDGSGGVEIFRALPGLRWAPPVDFELTSARAVSVGVGDFNDDGRPDLVFFTAGGDVVILFADGRGGYGGPAVIDVDRTGGQLLVADFDGDGRPDVAVTHGEMVTILYDPSSSGAEAAVTAAVGDTALAMTAGDFDGDARPDLAIATPHGFSILVNGGGRSLAAGVVHGGTAEGPTAISAGDLNGDGALDLALTATNFLLPGTVNLMFGDGRGGFVPGPRLTPGGDYAQVGLPSDVRIADLNGDRRADLLVLDPSLGSLTVLLQTAGGALVEGPSHPAGAGPRLVVPADLQGNGIVDLVLLESVTGFADTLTVLPGLGGGSFDAPPAFPAPSGTIGVAVADFDGDGNPDLALGGSDIGALGFLRGDGRGGFESLERPGDVLLPFSLIVKAADFDHDGRPDLLVASQSGSRLYLFRSTGPLEFAAPEIHDIDRPEEVLVDDFNGDGLLDVLVVQRGDRADLLLGSGPGKLQDPRFIDFDFLPLTGAVTDVDGDGLTDVLLPSFGGQVWLLRGRGDASFDAPVLAFDQESDPNGVGSTRVPRGIALADFDGDGNLDFALTDEGASGGVDIVLANGDGSFRLGSLIDLGYPTGGVVTLDWDHDGILDLAVIREDHDFVTILIGAGDGTFRKLGDLPTGGRTMSLAVADLDGDGQPDLAAANSGRGIPAGGILTSSVALLTNHCGDRVRVGPPTTPASRQSRTVPRRPGALPAHFD